MFTCKHEEGDDTAFMLEILELDGAHGGPRRDILQQTELQIRFRLLWRDIRIQYRFEKCKLKK